MTRKMSNYKKEINRLTKEVDEQRKKLDEIGARITRTKGNLACLLKAALGRQRCSPTVNGN